MDFQKSLLLTVSLSCLLLSSHASIAPSVSPAPTTSKTEYKVETNIFEEAVKVSQTVFKPEPEVLEFCTGTENPTLCADTIAPYFHGSFDPIKALETEIDATLNKTLSVAGVISKSLNNPSTNKKTLDALDICKSQYKSIVDTIKEAKELLNQQNVVDAYYKFSSVISDRTACEDAFAESPGADSPFADDSFAVYELGGNCLAIMDGIVNNHNKYMI
ncbi:Pectinesterase inhibitor domain [Sesbania bispinosa]|nr:Pectinesterase inhibitor domain [Sesbania bispinosa]